MLISSLKDLFSRDLGRLSKEIQSYKDEKNLWIIDKDILNSGGNLCLHLIGNINTFIGAGLGKTGYVRDRPAEFNTKDVPVSEMVKMIEDTKVMVNKTLSNLSASDLEKEYPMIVFQKPMTTTFFLIHLAGHLTYHLGQVNYHRRLLDNGSLDAQERR